jgi:SAM-dependent methyltransferase
MAAVLAALPGCRMQTVQAPAPPPAPAVQPRPMSRRVASAHLEDIFVDIPNSSIDDFRKDTPEQERAKVNAAHGEEGLKESNAHVYGEPSVQATDLILRRLRVGADDVVYDLGCGRAFFLMQSLLTTPLRKAVGLELATSRIAIARLARQKLLDQGLLQGKILDLREQDIAETDLGDATVVFMDSVFFSDQLLGTVARNMARARNLRAVVMITKGLPANPWFELEGKERLKMSWSPRFG